MFDEVSIWVALAFVGVLAVGAGISRLTQGLAHKHDDRIHPAE